MRKPEVMAITVKIRVGMAGWMSARAATVVDRVPPSYRKVKDYLRISRLYLDIRAELSSFSILPRGFLNILKPISESPQTSPYLERLSSAPGCNCCTKRPWIRGRRSQHQLPALWSA